LSGGDTFALADASRHEATLAFMITDGHPQAAAAAQNKPLQQGAAFARGTLSASGSAGLGIAAQPLLVFLVLFPGNYSGPNLGINVG